MIRWLDYLFNIGPYFYKKNSFIFNFLFHNSHAKFDRQIVVSDQINQIELYEESVDVVLGSKEEFVVTEA